MENNSQEIKNFQLEKQLNIELQKAGFSDIEAENIIEKARSGVYADTPENRKKGRVGSKFGGEKKPELDSKGKKLLDSVKSVDGSIKDLKHVKFQKTPKGNWLIHHKGEAVGTAQSHLIDEDLIDKHDMWHDKKDAEVYRKAKTKQIGYNKEGDKLTVYRKRINYDE